MESESGTHKVSDSGYSNSCSNSQSQRSGSSNSRNSGSNSSRSSGYCGHPSTVASSEAVPQPISKRNKDKEHKKKKPKCNGTAAPAPVATVDKAAADPQQTCAEELAAGCDVACHVDLGAAPNGTAAVPSSPRLPAAAEGAVPHAATPLTSPHTPIAAETAQGDVEPVSKWDDEKMRESPLRNDEAICMDLFESTPQPECADSGATPTCQPEDGFCCVISMYDGVVLYTTPSLTAVLGFPKDMWLGRSFIEFVHQKDREAFTTHITNGLAKPMVNSQNKDVRTSVFVNLRRYRSLKSAGFSIVDKPVSYQPFSLTFTFRQIQDHSDPNAEDCQGRFLVIIAVPVHSCYRVPNEECESMKFSTSHTSSCQISNVDEHVVTNLGYFPQDMIGKSILDFYYWEDYPMISEMYAKVMEKCKTAGSSFQSKPYRFAAQNGGYVTVKTEWTNFVNPWSRKLEILIGHHKVLQGPGNPDVFDIAKADVLHIPEDRLKESNIIREKIQQLLSQSIQLDSVKKQISKRCKDLTIFMEMLTENVSKSNLKIDLPQENDTRISDRDSVMLGEISPHHDYYDSKSSSETPPSYNQLNYNENIQRFFKSKPMTTASDEFNGPLQSTTDTDQEGKSSSAVQESSSNTKCLSPVHGSGASGSGSGNLSSESNPHMENGTSGTNTSNDSYKPPHLTEALLFKHNEDMEKIMVKRHKEQRSITKSERDREGKKSHHKSSAAIQNLDKFGNQHQGGHGVKRCGSHSWEEDNHKFSKHQHQQVEHKVQNGQETNTFTTPQKNSTVQVGTMAVSLSSNDNAYQSATDNNVNLWPPFSVTVTPMHTTQPCTTGVVNTPAPGYATGMFPAVYYIPAHTGQSPREYPGPPIAGPMQLQYMPSMMYPTMFGTSPVLYPSVTMLQPMPMPVQQSVQQPVPPSDNVKEARHKLSPPSTSNVTPSKGLFQRPASQATSVKAEPGSALGSIASASVVNRAMSECSRKDLGLQSVCSPDSPMVSPQDGETTLESYNGAAKVPEHNECVPEPNIDSAEGDEESSYSSFYSSFLKTDTGSGSNEDNNHLNSRTNKTDSDDMRWRKPKPHPIRKLNPPWLDNVNITPDLIYRYQMSIKSNILESDLNSLKDLNQPQMVNDQLSQLYLEMELEGISSKSTLEEGLTSSSSSSEETSKQIKPKKKRRSYSKLVMIYEEDAPLPSPTSGYL